MLHFATRYCKVLTKEIRIFYKLMRLLGNFSGFTFKHAPTIKDKFVRSFIPASRQETWLRRPKVNFSCANSNYCINIVQTNTFEDKINKKKFEITDFINCNSTHVIYRLECLCKCFYIGLTKRRLHD